MDLVRYFVRYRIARSASTEGATIPAMSSCFPNRATCAGPASGSAWSRASCQVGSSCAGVGVDVVVAVPAWSAIHVDRCVEARPPHLQIRRPYHLLDHLARDRAPDRGMQMRRQPLLRFDGGEVLHPVAGDPTQVLPEPVHQPRKHHRIECGTAVVVGVRIDRCTRPHRPVRRQGEGEEHRRAVGAAVVAGEAAAHGVRSSIGTLGRSGVSPRRRVDRIRREVTDE